MLKVLGNGKWYFLGSRIHRRSRKIIAKIITSTSVNIRYFISTQIKGPLFFLIIVSNIINIGGTNPA